MFYKKINPVRTIFQVVAAIRMFSAARKRDGAAVAHPRGALTRHPLLRFSAAAGSETDLG